jgi:adenine deaminase
MSGKEDEGSILRDLAEAFPMLKEMRLANPPGAQRFLFCTKDQSEHWPVDALIDGYLDALP